MRGLVNIEVYDNRIHYFLTLRRNITVIRGDSGTGKTVLFEMIRSASDRGKNTGIFIKSDKPCQVLDAANWELIITNSVDTVFFIDEGVTFLSSHKFQKLANQNPNYFVIITREPFTYLTYSCNEIYGFREVGKYRNARQIYNEMYNIYEKNIEINRKITTIVTEDKCSGFEFFSHVFDNICKCVSAEGRDKIQNIVLNLSNSGKDLATVMVIADGAAFGSAIHLIYGYAKYKGMLLYLPESFEWLILHSRRLKLPKLSDVLEHTWDFVESSQYLSWERFFTDYLVKGTLGTPFHYSKIHLNKIYLNDDMYMDILDNTPLKSLLRIEDKGIG